MVTQALLRWVGTGRMIAASLVLATCGLAVCGCRPALRTAIGVREIEPRQLERWAAQQADVLVIDVRSADEYAAGHIPGARSVQLGELDGTLSQMAGPRDRPVVLVCGRGLASLEAAAVAAAHGFDHAFSLAEGMDGWLALGLELERGPPVALEPRVAAPPQIRASTFVQTAVVVTAFGVKPLHMVLSLLLLLWLWRATARDLVLLRRGLACFLAGEIACAVNYLGFDGCSGALELAHGLGMVLMGGLITWGLFAMLDDRVLRWGDPDASCAALRFCRRCWKREQAPCGLQRVMLLAAPVLALTALTPLSRPLRPLNVTIAIFGTEVPYVHPVAEQLAEFRAYPLLAVLLLVITTVLLARGPRGAQRAHLPFFAALGLLSYALLRYVLTQSFRPMPPWADAWEEITELFMVLLVGLTLWAFRHPLALAAGTSDRTPQTPRQSLPQEAPPSSTPQ